MLSQCDASMASDLEVRETMTYDFQHPANHKDISSACNTLIASIVHERPARCCMVSCMQMSAMHTNTWKNMVVLPSGGLLCENQVFERTLVC